MGLELVELHMAVEDEFGVRLPIQSFTTVGEFFNSIVGALRRQRGTASFSCPCVPSFFIVRNALRKTWSASTRIYPSTPLAALLPNGRLVDAWERLEYCIGIRLPPPTPAREIGAVLFAFLGAAIIVGPGLLSLLDGFAVLVAGGLAFFLLVLLLNFAMFHLPRRLPREVVTVGDLVRSVVPPQGTAEHQTDDLLWRRFVSLVSDQLDVPTAEIRRDSQFVRDLKCD